MFLRYGFALFASILSSATAHAAIYTVGAAADAACNYTGIGAAAAAAEAHPGADTIRVASPDAADPNAAYTNQAIVFTASQELDIVGGFANCSQAASSGSQTIIDGAGGATEPVFRITVPIGGLVRLSYLTIQHGDEDGSGKGGGIYFKGDGTLQLDHCSVSQNIAGYGGGIYAESTTFRAQLVIGEDVSIVGNTARYDGGGIVNDGTIMTMTQPDSYIAVNHAQGVLSADGQYLGGHGGGLLVSSVHSPAHSDLGSSGLGTLGAIYLNDARRGGGVAVMGGDDDTATLRLFTTDPARPMRIRGNTASEYGGGVSLASASGDDGFGYVGVWYGYFEDNIAPHGAAIDVRQIQGFAHGGFDFSNGSGPPGSADCPIGKPCGGVIGNAAIDNASQPVGGVVEASTSISMLFNLITFEGNTGKSVFQGDGGGGFLGYPVAITGNTVSGSLLDGEGIYLRDATIAGNSIGDDTVLRLGGTQHFSNTLMDSIIWQPGKTTVHTNGSDTLQFQNLMVSERDSIDGGNSPWVFEQDPRFVDPEHGDYSLRAGSPAVDRIPEGFLFYDLYFNRRNVDLPIAEIYHGVRDIGAIERQYLQPLVLNSDFDADLRLWSPAGTGVTTWDATKNVTGAAGSGSAHVTAPSAITGSSVGGLVQCVHLPGPGTYLLNGWGHGTGTAVTLGDIAQLYWEFRKDGEESCTHGVPNASGTQVLSRGNSWSRPAKPALIEVTEPDWTHNSSIAVTLVAVEFGPSGAPTNAWFDGVTLEVDAILADGFENP
jgi:predicted outer membrane repeat protein